MAPDSSYRLAGGNVPNRTFRIIDSIAAIESVAWNRLAGTQPFLQHAFLHALETTHCVGRSAGWLPQHLTLWRGAQLAAAMPMYVKQHSYGEYVFDWAWADAYAQNDLAYYPKLLSAIPFTPVTGRRLLAENDADRKLLILAAVQYARDAGLSSFHCLFPTETERAIFADAGLLLRHDVQFHWLNQAFRSFDDYVAAMSHDKRKKIRQERRRVADQGIIFHQLRGAEIREEHWAFFTGCYETTYRQHRSRPYLNLEFFRLLGSAMPENVLMILASRDGRNIAAALNLHDSETLYGRYWGTQEYLPGLHFETCYYQAIEFCIAHGIARFEGGAQGEHKLARGFLPVKTCSAHWLAHPAFADAIEKYLARESVHIADYIGELSDRNPYRTDD